MLVRVHDSYGVMAVWMQVLDAAGPVLEEGPDQLVADEWWAYTTHTHPVGAARQLLALAHDWPSKMDEKYYT